MEKRSKDEGSKSSRREESRSKAPRAEDSGVALDSVAEQIRAVAAYNARAPLNSDKQLTLFLQSWWSKTYNRPLKDPLLLSYSLEELLYEFYDRIERQLAEDERLEQEDDKIEEGKEKAVLDWAEEEERKEAEKEAAKAAQQTKEEPPQNPASDPENVKWMEEQLKSAKQEHGESFGEDLELQFED